MFICTRRDSNEHKTTNLTSRDHSDVIRVTSGQRLAPTETSGRPLNRYLTGIRLAKRIYLTGVMLFMLIWLSLCDLGVSLMQLINQTLEYDFDVIHKPGKKHTHIDCLYRMHLNNSETECESINAIQTTKVQ